jgi:hypothetical protein
MRQICTQVPIQRPGQRRRLLSPRRSRNKFKRFATAEQELRKLRETRIGASPSDRITTLQLFANSEKQYPSDYRFEYERATVHVCDTKLKAMEIPVMTSACLLEFSIDTLSFKQG